ncbi:MAG: pilus assembly protein [Pirellulales bacterium]|nr:pilus assembly protein [Pirellulales bacterium]
MDPFASNRRVVGCNPRARRRPEPGSRSGAVAVEFACVAPLLLGLIVGVSELTRIYEVQNVLETAAREGARFAALDRDGMLLPGQTANTKLTSDVKNFLATMGFDKNDVAVAVVRASDPSQAFDLDDPANDMELFKVQVSIPYSKVSYTPVAQDSDYALSAAITFRNGRATLSD